MSETIVLKIGGSLLSRSEDKLFDFDYFYQLKRLLEELTAQDYRFLINVGGGYITRKYQKLASTHGETDVIDVHKIGIALTNLNAQIFHGLLGDLAWPEILRYSRYDEFLNAPHRNFDFYAYKVVVAGGSRPGKSNDWNALQFALNLGVSRVIDVKNVDGVYTADPKSDPSATRLDKLSWDEYMDIIGNPTEHKPGANYPVDPFAARDAKAKGVEFAVIGESISNLKSAITGNNFIGTVIK